MGVVFLTLISEYPVIPHIWINRNIRESLNERMIEGVFMDFQAKMDDFIGWMEKDGMLGRWKRQRELAEVSKQHRKLNKKIRETEAMNKLLEEAFS
jgi:hypothetical protein